MTSSAPIDPDRPETFEDFYVGYAPSLIRFLLVEGFSFAVAAEATQESMTQLYKCWNTVRSPRAWVRTAARHIAITEAGATRNLFDEPPEPEPLISLAEATRIEVQSDFLRLLEPLSPRHRQVLARLYDGDTTAEIASELEIKESTVRATIRDARARMKHHRAGREEGRDV